MRIASSFAPRRRRCRVLEHGSLTSRCLRFFVFPAPHGVYLAIAIAFSTLAVVSAVCSAGGRWKTRGV